MNQRGIVLVAGYLSRRPKGRVVRVKPVGPDDYVIRIEDVRDGRTHIVRTADDLERWLVTFTGSLRAGGVRDLRSVRPHPS